jgi:hypothetical protein
MARNGQPHKTTGELDKNGINNIDIFVDKSFS